MQTAPKYRAPTATNTSEMLVNAYQTTRRHNLANRNLQAYALLTQVQVYTLLCVSCKIKAVTARREGTFHLPSLDLTHLQHYKTYSDCVFYLS
jgi:hypothetical protein